MSKRAENSPAWRSTNPTRHAEQAPASDADEREIREAFPDAIAAKNLSLEGRYSQNFVVSFHERPPLLVKLSDELRQSDRDAYSIAEFLYATGVQTPRPVLITAMPGKRAICAYEHVPNDLINPDKEEVARLGAAVAVLQDALCTHENVAEWSARSDRRLSALSEVRVQLACGALSVGPRAGDLAQLARRDDLDFVRREKLRAPTHGDLNLGNAFVSTRDREVFLIDFEDAPHSVVAPEFEAALVIERFIFERERRDDEARMAAIAFLDALSSYEGAQRRFSGRVLYEAVLSLNLRSLCVLAELETAGVVSDEAEWLKFFALFAEAERRRDLWLSLSED